MIQENMLDC